MYLVQEFRKDPTRYIPAYEFVGEKHLTPVGQWYLMSYKCPTRLTEVFQENPGILERTRIEGKSGATYYGYRIQETADPDMIQNEKLCKLYETYLR